MYINLIPAAIKQKYNLSLKVHNGYVYIEIRKGMCVLPQGGVLASNLLTKLLALEGYVQTIVTPSLWHHVWRLLTISVVLNGFVVKYVGHKHA